MKRFPAYPRILLIALLTICALTILVCASDSVVTSEEQFLSALNDSNCDRIIIENGSFVELTQNVLLTKDLIVQGLETQTEGYTCLNIPKNASLTLADGVTLQTLTYRSDDGVPGAQGMILLNGGTLDLRAGNIGQGSNVFRTTGTLLYEGSTEGLQFDQSVKSEQELLDVLASPLYTFSIIQSDVTLTQDLTLTKSALVTDGATFTVPEGVKLTIPEERYLIIADGRFDVKGAITGDGDWTGKEEPMPEGTVIVETWKEFENALSDPDCKSILITGKTEIHIPNGLSLTVGKPVHCVASWDDGSYNKLIIEQGASLTLSKSGSIDTVGPDDNGLSRIVVFGKLDAANGTIPDRTNIVLYADDGADLRLPPNAKPNVDYVVKTPASLKAAIEDENCSLVIVENGAVLELDEPITLTKDLAVLASEDPEKETAVILHENAVLTLAEGTVLQTRNTFDESGFPKGIAEIRVAGGSLQAQNCTVEEKTRFYVAGGTIALPENARNLEVIFEAKDLAGLTAALNHPVCTDIAICGNIELTEDLTLTKSAIIDDDLTVTVPEGVTLTVAQDVVLIYFNDSNLNVQGTITGDGWWPGKPETPAVKRGDVNGDDALNAKDVTMLRRYLAGGYGVTVPEAAADTNRDESINAKDVTTLRRYLAGGYGVTLE